MRNVQGKKEIVEYASGPTSNLGKLIYYPL